VSKNRSPKNIALIISILWSLFLISVLVFFEVGFAYIALNIAVSFVLSFLLIDYFIRIFINRKIELIYKTIHHLKSDKNTPRSELFMHDDVIEAVKKDVVKWAADQDKQLTTLRDQEKFRREFLANISHELKTPIFSIQGYIHTLLDGALDDEKVNIKFLEKAAKSADRLEVLVEDLLAISKIEKGNTTLDFERFDICALSKEVWDDLELIASNKHITFKIKDGCNQPFFVKADIQEIKKVLENLFSNSIKYGKESGQTTIAFYEMGSNILTEITDNGEGINENDLPRLFERFYRVEKSRSREMGGTGLGLSIVKHIIESHKQTINVRSAVGVGTTFGFTLKKKT
jgi:two-component system phosphate regulon sensor histidine kinase PhoR